VLAAEQSLVDEVAAQGHVVGRATGTPRPKDDVDLLLGKPPAGLERLHYVLQYRSPARPSSRQAQQPAVGQERA
jgi:hypothetical protein